MRKLMGFAAIETGLIGSGFAVDRVADLASLWVWIAVASASFVVAAGLFFPELKQALIRRNTPESRFRALYPYFLKTAEEVHPRNRHTASVSARRDIEEFAPMLNVLDLGIPLPDTDASLDDWYFRLVHLAILAKRGDLEGARGLASPANTPSFREKVTHWLRRLIRWSRQRP